MTEREEWFTLKCKCGHEDTLLEFMTSFGEDGDGRTNLWLLCDKCAGFQILGEIDIVNLRLKQKEGRVNK